MKQTERIRELITRLARLDAAESWGEDLNPAQRAALDYLSRANRFSRSPSHLADYLGSTRGTVSQTLKSLAQKGYVNEARSETDKRAITFDLTDRGAALAAQSRHLTAGIDGLPPEERCALEGALEAVLMAIVSQNARRPFGICRDCRHFANRQGQPYCGLLSLALRPQEPAQICHEQDPK